MNPQYLVSFMTAVLKLLKYSQELTFSPILQKHKYMYTPEKAVACEMEEDHRPQPVYIKMI